LEISNNSTVELLLSSAGDLTINVNSHIRFLAHAFAFVLESFARPLRKEKRKTGKREGLSFLIKR